MGHFHTGYNTNGGEKVQIDCADPACQHQKGLVYDAQVKETFHWWEESLRLQAVLNTKTNDLATATKWLETTTEAVEEAASILTSTKIQYEKRSDLTVVEKELHATMIEWLKDKLAAQQFASGQWDTPIDVKDAADQDKV